MFNFQKLPHTCSCLQQTHLHAVCVRVASPLHTHFGIDSPALTSSFNLFCTAAASRPCTDTAFSCPKSVVWQQQQQQQGREKRELDDEHIPCEPVWHLPKHRCSCLHIQHTLLAAQPLREGCEGPPTHPPRRERAAAGCKRSKHPQHPQLPVGGGEWWSTHPPTHRIYSTHSIHNSPYRAINFASVPEASLTRIGKSGLAFFISA